MNLEKKIWDNLSEYQGQEWVSSLDIPVFKPLQNWFEAKSDMGCRFATKPAKIVIWDLCEIL